MATLTACTPEPTVPATSPDPTSISTETPLPRPYSNADEAYKIALDTYTKFLHYMELTFQTHGEEGVEELQQFGTGVALEVADESLKSWINDDIWLVGYSKISYSKLQRYEMTGVPQIVLYVCQDINPTDVLDRDGKSVSNRDGLATLDPREVQVTFTSNNQPTVADFPIWSGKNFCE